MTENGRVQVIVAVVGIVGALGTALFANWDKIFPPDGRHEINVQPQADRPSEPGPQVPVPTKFALPKGSVILFDSFDSLGPAQGSLEKAKAVGFVGGVIFFKYSKYRPALVFPTADAANAQLSQVQTKLNGTAYVRDLASWCPSPVSGSTKFLSCANNGVF